MITRNLQVTHDYKIFKQLTRNQETFLSKKIHVKINIMKKFQKQDVHIKG